MKKKITIFKGEEIIIRNNREDVLIGCLIDNLKAMYDWEVHEYIDDYTGIPFTYQSRHDIALSLYKEIETYFSAIFYLSMTEKPLQHTFLEALDIASAL